MERHGATGQAPQKVPAGAGFDRRAGEETTVQGWQAGWTAWWQGFWEGDRGDDAPAAAVGRGVPHAADAAGEQRPN